MEDEDDGRWGGGGPAARPTGHHDDPDDRPPLGPKRAGQRDGGGARPRLPRLPRLRGRRHGQGLRADGRARGLLRRRRPQGNGRRRRLRGLGDGTGWADRPPAGEAGDRGDRRARLRGRPWPGASLRFARGRRDRRLRRLFAPLGRADERWHERPSAAPDRPFPRARPHVDRTRARRWRSVSPTGWSRPARRCRKRSPWPPGSPSFPKSPCSRTVARHTAAWICRSARHWRRKQTSPRGPSASRPPPARRASPPGRGGTAPSTRDERPARLGAISARIEFDPKRRGSGRPGPVPKDSSLPRRHIME